MLWSVEGSISYTKNDACYPVHKQHRILIPYCVLYNFIRMHTMTDRMFHEYSVEDLTVLDEESTQVRQEVPDIDLSQANISQIENIIDIL